MVYSNFIMQVVKCLPVLSQLLYHDNQNVISDACWSLSFLADGSNKRIQLVIDAGVTLRLIELLLWVVIYDDHSDKYLLIDIQWRRWSVQHWDVLVT